MLKLSHATAIALSAFLLFLVQPIIARQILPWFGGSAAVWTTCMVFFQVALLAGYCYSDWIIRSLTPRRQALVHSALLMASLAFLPITLSESMKPADAGQPGMRILWLLASTIGLPYLMLATTGPLVQAWFARRFVGARVYRLYALSNLASMAALIAYPPLIEPFASGRLQTIGWSTLYCLFAVLTVAIAWRSAGDPVVPTQTPSWAQGNRSPTPAPDWREQSVWLALSGLGSILLLAVTTHITQNVASIPFLWILPLSLYLITFMLCFDGEGWYRPGVVRPLAALATVAMAAGLSFQITGKGIERGILPIRHAVPLYSAGLFVLCMFLHGELVARKPAPAHLTRFYLMVSLGGALGGLLVGLLAPWVFDGYWELPLALIIVSLAMGMLSSGARRLGFTIAVIVCAALFADYLALVRGQTLEMSRNFYGTLRVRSVGDDGPKPARRQLVHGEILHGEQFLDAARRREATTYYAAQSGIGLALETMSTKPFNLGLIGAGVGTLAVHGRPGDRLTFYELNPAVVDLARRHFSFLSDSAATIEVALGDARLVLEREPDRGFTILVIDAFSSDAIPVHLLTREALAVYRRHMAPEGALAFHITNRYLDLAPVLASVSREAGWHGVLCTDKPSDGDLRSRSDWILMTAERALADRWMDRGCRPLQPPGTAFATWTDDHHNLFKILK